MRGPKADAMRAGGMTPNSAEGRVVARRETLRERPAGYARSVEKGPSCVHVCRVRENVLGNGNSVTKAQGKAWTRKGLGDSLFLQRCKCRAREGLGVYAHTAQEASPKPESKHLNS